MSSSKFAKTSVLVSVILVIGYFISFIKESLVAKYFGVSADVDAYTIAITIPVTLFSLVSVSVRSVIIPFYSDLYYNQGIEKASKYISNMLTCVGAGSLVLILLFELLASPLVTLFAPGFSHETHALSTKLLRLALPTIFFSLLENIMVGVLNVHKKFVTPSLSVYLLNSSLIIFLIFLYENLGILAACIGQVLGSMLSVSYIYYLSSKVYKYHFVFDYKDEYMMRSYKQSIPIMWSISIAELNAIVNRVVASFLFVGSIAALGYASKINSVMMTFFTTSIATIVYPLYSESSAKKDFKQLNRRINFTLSVYTFFLLPLMLGIFCFREEIIQLAFARGAFKEDAVSLISSLLGCYCIGILFMAFRETLTKVFYSLQDSKTPATNATIGLILNIILNVTLPFVLGIQGLALGTSLTAIFISVRLLYQLTSKKDGISVRIYLQNLKTIVIASLVLLVSCLVFDYYVSIENTWIKLSLGLLVGGGSYILASLSLRSKLLKQVIEILFLRK